MKIGHIWKQHPSDPKIWVSCAGKIWRKVNCTHPERRQWAERKVEMSKYGYARILIAGKKTSVHRIVYSLFVGPLKTGLVVCHKDGNSVNNCYSNLEQKTQLENIYDKKRHDTWQSGENHPRTVNTADEISSVLQCLEDVERTYTGRVKSGESAIIAEKCGVTLNVVRAASRNRVYWECLQ